MKSLNFRESILRQWRFKFVETSTPLGQGGGHSLGSIVTKEYNWKILFSKPIRSKKLKVLWKHPHSNLIKIMISNGRVGPQWKRVMSYKNKQKKYFFLSHSVWKEKLELVLATSGIVESSLFLNHGHQGSVWPQ